MITACRELSRMLGFNAPERLELVRSDSEAHLVERLECMSEDELLRMADLD